MLTFRPSRPQCHELFDWVLDLIEDGPPAEATPVPGSVSTLLFDIENARASVAFIVWPGEPKTIGFVEIVSY